MVIMQTDDSHRGGKRQGAGRKPLPSGVARQSLTIRLTPAELDFIYQLRDERGISLSAVIALALAVLRARLLPESRR